MGKLGALLDQRLGSGNTNTDEPVQPVSQKPSLGQLLDQRLGSGQTAVSQEPVDATPDKVGASEQFKQEFSPGGLIKKIPITGAIANIQESGQIIATANRLKDQDFDYNKANMQVDINQRGRSGVIGNLQLQKPSTLSREKDLQTISTFIKDFEQQQKERTLGGKVVAGLSQMPTWMAEFMLTGGLASLGDDVAKKAGEKLLKGYAKTAVGKAAIKTAGLATGAVARTTGLTSRVAEKTAQRQALVETGLKEQEGWGTSLAKAWGDTVIESFSEETGGLITKGLGKGFSKLPFGKKFISGLQKAWTKVTGKTADNFATKLLAKGGYSSILGEIGEERVGTILREATGVSDREGGFASRIWEGMKEDFQPENIGAEAITLAVPGVAGKVAGFATGQRQTAEPQAETSAERPPTVQQPDINQPDPEIIASIEAETPVVQGKQPVDVSVERPAKPQKPETSPPVAKPKATLQPESKIKKPVVKVEGEKVKEEVVIQKIPVYSSKIEIPEGTPDNKTVDDYVARIKVGEKIDPIVAEELPDGSLLIKDGHHRLAATKKARKPLIDIKIKKFTDTQKSLDALHDRSEATQKTLQENIKILASGGAIRPRRRIQPIKYQSYKENKPLTAKSYVEYKNYKIVKESKGLYNILDKNNKTVSQYAGINGAVKAIDSGKIAKPKTAKQEPATKAKPVQKKPKKSPTKAITKSLNKESKPKTVKKQAFTPDPVTETGAKGEPGFAGIAGRPGGKAQKPWLDNDKTVSPDADVEQFFGRTKKMPSKLKASSLVARGKAGFRERFLTATPHIPDGKEFALARDMIRTMPEEQRGARSKAMKDVVDLLDGDGTVKALDAAGLDLLRRKVFTQDLLHEAEIERSVSGNLTKSQLEAENKRLDALISKVPSVKKAFDARQEMWKKISQDLFDRGVLNEDTKDNTSYVRHFVLDYIASNRQPVSTKKKKLSEPYRTYGKKRTGSTRDISTDYLAVEVNALADIYADNAIEDAAGLIGKKYDKTAQFKAEAKKTGKSVDEVALDNGYVEWHYKRPNLFYQARTLSEAKMAAMIENSAEDAGEMLNIPASEMRKALVLGKRKGMYIPQGLAIQLDNLPVNRRSGFVVESFTKPMWQWWKRWILRVNPLRYNARNQLGDMERLHASGQTAAIKKIPAALKLLTTKEGEIYTKAQELGVIGSSLWHEMGDVTKSKDFEKFKNISTQKSFARVVKKTMALPLRGISKVGQIEQDLTQIREDVLRLAVYMNNLEKIQKGVKVRHWAGDLADINEIAKDSPERAAAKLSRETLIDYGSFTSFENDVFRNGLLPFYSFFKRNATFWPRAIKNAAKEGKGGKAGKVAATKAATSVAKWLVRVLGGYALAFLWNNRDDEAQKIEESLPFWQRSTPHVNIGNKSIWGQTALSDFGEWFDKDALAAIGWRLEAGYLSPKEAGLEAAKSIAKAPVNRFAQALNPFIKAPITAVTGQSLYPDIFDPKFVAPSASKKSAERAILDILGSDAKKFYQSALTKIRQTRGEAPSKYDRAFTDTLYAYFAGWWMKPLDPEELAAQVKRSKKWSALKSASKTTGRKKGEAKKGKEAQLEEALIREKALNK